MDIGVTIEIYQPRGNWTEKWHHTKTMLIPHLESELPIKRSPLTLTRLNKVTRMQINKIPMLLALVLCWVATCFEQDCSIVAEPQTASSRYFVDVERYRFGDHPNPLNPNFYPIPQGKITKETYYECVDAFDPALITKNPNQGMHGPQTFMPVLAKYVQTGESRWSDACIAMLKKFHQELQQRVSDRGWLWQFEHPAALLPLYRKYLIEGGAMSADAPWFRAMWLFYCRNLHVWDSEPIEWRGGCHRSMPEGYAKGRAAEWYPDIPEAADWKRYSELVFGDFWKTKDVPQNDTGYMMGPLIILACGGEQWTGDDRVFLDPGMRRLWDRLLVEISPDGLINPYGPNGGWNSTADYRIAILELLSNKTNDGRYRFGAHKLLNYLRYQSRDVNIKRRQIDSGAPWLIALAAIWADDRIPPKIPVSGSQWNKRGEAVRIPHTDKKLTNQLLGNADFRENRGHICCSWHMTGKEWPDKLILRSGWNPGDFFGVVELHPTSFPANPGGIMGLNRWGTPFTQIVTSKGASVENRILIEDLNGEAPPRFHSDKLRIDEFWKQGSMPDIRSEVSYFKDTPQATYAQLRVENMDGLPVIYEREFIFAKNRFLATREVVTFEESFHVRLAPLWNTHNIGPQIGEHWANTFIHQPVANNGTRSMKCPPVDLLVWFAPNKSCELQIIDRLSDDPRAEACPNQVRYLWEGKPAVGEKLVFTQVYYPHAPYRSRPTSNNPNPDATAAYANKLQATAHASGIQILRDTPEVSVLRLELNPNQVEWVMFNPHEETIEFESHVSDEPFLYITSSQSP